MPRKQMLSSNHSEAETMRIGEPLRPMRRVSAAGIAAKVSVRALAALAIILTVVAGGGPGADAFVELFPTFQGLIVPAAGNSLVAGISGDGQVVIGNQDGGSCGQAVSWSRDPTKGFRFHELGLPGGGSCSFANGANSNGSVFGGVGYNSGANAPVIWVNGTSTALPQNYNCCGSPPPPCGAGILGANANAVGLSNSVLVGADASGNPGCGPGIPVEWVNGTESALFGWNMSGSGEARGVNADGSVVVGRVGVSCSSGTCSEAFRTAAGSTTILGDLGGGSSEAYATNADGSVVVGTAAVDSVNSQAFRWTAATGMVGLCPAQVFATAYAVSADGSVVVGQTGNDGQAFRWTAATGCQTIADLLTAAGFNVSNWHLTQALGISADGSTIVGNGSNGIVSEAWVAYLPVASGSGPPRSGGIVMKRSGRL